MGLLQQTVWQWRHKRGVFIAAVLAIMVLLALVIAVEADWVKERADQWLRSQPECQSAPRAEEQAPA